MNTIVKIGLSLLAAACLLTISISSSMLRARYDGYSGVYPFAVIPAVAYLHWFAWYAFIPLKSVGPLERGILEKKMEQYYSKGTFAGCVSFGYLLVFFYVAEWFLDSGKSPIHFHNFAWTGVAFIVTGLLARLHGLLRFLLLERK